MEIRGMIRTKDPSWKTKAFFSVDTKNFIIHDCRLVESPSGRLVVQMPYRSKLTEPVIHIKDVDYLEAVGEAAIMVYESKR
jgi:hypothetical protein